MREEIDHRKIFWKRSLRQRQITHLDWPNMFRRYLPQVDYLNERSSDIKNGK